MEKKCAFCDGRGPLVQITCARSDTLEVLDTCLVCPECFNGFPDTRELFTGVVATDPDSGVAHLTGRGPDDC